MKKDAAAAIAHAYDHCLGLAAPAVAYAKNQHRKKVRDHAVPFYPAAIARKVPRSEWSKKEVRDALDLEWEKLRTHEWPDGRKDKKGVWVEFEVRSAADVRREAQRLGAKVHFGRICELCYEKGAELLIGDKERKFKG